MYRIALTSDLHYGFEGIRSHHAIERMFTELKKEDFDILILAGDTISHSQSQWDPVLKLIREHFPKTTILGVMGNHDYWQDVNNRKRMSIIGTINNQRKMFDKYDIIYLHEVPFVDENITIYGVDGWYGSTYPPSNDLYWMPKRVGDIDTHTFLFQRSDARLRQIPDKTENGENVVFVTHFEPNDEPMGGPYIWLDMIAKKADVLLMAHSHKECDKVMADNNFLRMVNCGSDYLCPKYKIIEV